MITFIALTAIKTGHCVTKSIYYLVLVAITSVIFIALLFDPNFKHILKKKYLECSTIHEAIVV